MTQEVWIISDTHFGHSATFEVFKKNDGSPLRPFKDLDDMHNTFISNWNSVVKPQDLVLHLGDVSFCGKSHDAILPQLKGEKRLIRGNHDRFTESRYRRFFNRIEGCYIRDKYVFTHIPIHPESLSRWSGNIHGHLHANVVNDPRYFNASCEQINFTPINLEEVKKIMRGQNETSTDK